MVDTTQNDSGNNNITFDISSLAASATFVAGRESNQQDNTADNYMNALVDVKGIAGHASTAPSIGDSIRLYLWGSDISLATTPIDVLDGVDSAETLGHVAVLNSLKHVQTSTVTVATAALLYYFQPFAVASFFGGVMPKFWGLYLTHDHTGALAAAQTGLFRFTGVKYTTL